MHDADESAPKSRLERWGIAAENAVLVGLFTALMVLAVAQIVLRIGFDSGFIWNDELQKLIVLWITLVASIAASRNDRHLRIDLLSHFVPERYSRWPRAIVDSFAAAVCAVLAWHSYRYLELTREFGDTLVTGIDMPAWWAYSILPIGFGIMSYRFLVASAGRLFDGIRQARAS
ncbi:MAG: TRAP transporter small permease [Woeseiaceae bacterium]|nr:TRAP transporter small permease [Woeseiaceae bacterium]